ncbi:MAG TPA: ABC transporter ATP-binding protein [Burkholderiales bacterium]|nr:ABC transporter ATP-binding protein [Burkholderiales bacterium]
MTSLAIENLEAGYGAVRALHGVSLEVREGETVALLGTNGNGKSTLMKCIMGQVKPSRGSIVLEVGGRHVDLARLDTQDIVALGVAMVPEGRRLFPRLTVQENLMLGAFRREARAAISRNLALCHDAFPVLRDRASQRAGELSGGQQQMLAIARALMSAPRLLLVDEPSVGLSPALVKQTVDTIGALKAQFGLTVLMAEQNFHQASRIADRGYVIVQGQIAFAGRDLAELQGSELVKSYYLGA